MTSENPLRGACSCGRYNYIVHLPNDVRSRQEAIVHFGTGDLNQRSHGSVLSAWLKVPLTWYQSVTVSQFPDERHDHIARTFTPNQQPGCQRKFCGFCGTHISYWTEEPVSEQNYMNITLGSLGRRDLSALEDLDLLPDNIDLDDLDQLSSKSARNTAEISAVMEQTVAPSPAGRAIQESRSGTSGGMSWFEDMIQGSQLGHHSKKRKGHGTSTDGTTTVTWEVSEYYGDDGEDEQPTTGSKRKAEDIEEHDTKMKD